MPQTTPSPLGSRASHKPSAKREVLLGYFFLIILTGRLIGFLIFRESSFIIYVHGHFRDVHVDSGALFFKNIHGHFKVHVHFFVKLFTGTFKIHGHFFPVHGHFFGFTGKFGLKSSRASAKCSRALLGNCSRPLFKCSRGRKKNTALNCVRLRVSVCLLRCVFCFGEGGKEQERIINMLPLRQKSLFGGWDKFEKKLYRERFGPGVLLGQQPRAAAQT